MASIASPRDRDPSDWPPGGGEMGELIRSTDWSQTKLGPVEDWPKSLRTMVGVLLGSRFPMLLWWGPDLLHLYNDAYRPILRDKHPASLGAPAAEVWAEVWDVAGPMARGVQAGGPATWTQDLQLFINSGGMAEETYFTFSYSAVPGDDGRVGGVLNTVQETTAKVQSERQILMQNDLAARTADTRSEDDAYRIAVDVLASNELDFPFVLLYVLNESGDAAHLVSGPGGTALPASANPTLIPIGDARDATAWPVAEAIETAREVLVEDLAARFGEFPVGRWNARVDRAIVLPLVRTGQSTAYAALVAGVSPHRALDDRYRRFFRSAADQVMTVVTRARAYEVERRRAESLAEIDRVKTTFFSNVSHEFRTPLTLMLGPLADELAEHDRPLPPERRARIEAAHRNSVRLLKLVNTLLDFSRGEAGRLQATYEPVDLAEFTTELASVFRSAIERGGLRLTVDCPPLPQRPFVDKDMWEKIVLNLLSNALKHTFAGEIRVSLRWLGEHAELTVTDSGVGIPESELPHVFDRFYRVRGAQSRTHEGTGVGLALVQELVRAHGGTVHASSVEGKGSVFAVRIPAGSEHLPPERLGVRAASGSTAERAVPYVQEALHWTADQAPLPAGTDEISDAVASPEATAVSVPGGRPRPRVLLADDNADMRDYVSRLLAVDYDVTAVADGLAALEAARTAPPDLVLTDVMMPGLDGFALLRELRSGESTGTIPVVLLSARAGEESAVEGLLAGADDYLVKPFSARELTARVRTHVELSRLRRRWGTELEQRVRERTAELLRSCQELEAEVAERERAEERLREAQQGALQQERLRALGQMASGLAHDINNAISPASIYTQSLLESETALSARARGQLETIQRAIDDTAKAVTRMREFCRQREPQLVLAPIHLNAVAQHAIDLTRARWSDMAQHRGADIQLVTRFAADLPDVMGAESEIREALINLVLNAVDAMPAGGTLTLGTRTALGPTAPHADAPPDRVLVEVTDTGTGMDEDTRRRCLEPFFTTKGELGTGLGLAMVFGVVQRHSAQIDIDTQPGAGTTMRLSFLASRTGVVAEGRAPALITGVRRRILLVDDDPRVLKTLCDALAADGHDVVAESGGQSALDAFAAALGGGMPFDVVITDLGMPNVDGLKLAAALNAASASTPVIMLTGWGQSVGERGTMPANIRRVLGKPPKLRDLRDAIARATGGADG